MSVLVDFLEGRGPDAAGRGIDRVLTFGPRPLERHQDFIPWLFPLAEASPECPGAPVLTPEDVLALRRSPSAQYNLARARTHMIWFYETTDHWLSPEDSNHQCIARIIRSLRLLAGDHAADGFQRRIHDRIARERAVLHAERLRRGSRAFGGRGGSPA